MVVRFPKIRIEPAADRLNVVGRLRRIAACRTQRMQMQASLRIPLPTMAVAALMRVVSAFAAEFSKCRTWLKLHFFFAGFLRCFRGAVGSGTCSGATAGGCQILRNAISFHQQGSIFHVSPLIVISAM